MQSRHIRILMGILSLLLLSACFSDNGSNSPSVSVSSKVPISSPEPSDETPVPEESPSPLFLFGQSVDPSTEKLLVQESVSDLSLVREAFLSLPELKEITLSLVLPSLDEYEVLRDFLSEWDNLLSQFPEIDPSVVFLLDNGTDPASVTEWTPSGLSEDELGHLSLLKRVLPNLSSLNLCEVAPSKAAISGFIKAYPSCTVIWNDPDFGNSSTDIVSLKVTNGIGMSSLKEYIECLPLLKEIDLMDSSFSEAESSAFAQEYPAFSLHRTVTLNGKSVDSYSESLDFSNSAIENVSAFSDSLSFFPKLTRLDMHESSLSNEQLASIRDRYPQIKVVWTVKFKKWKVRTDAVAFSTKQDGYNKNRLKASDVDCLRYCTDLIALDLGHNAITDLDFLKSLTNLQVLILSDNRGLKDISVIGSLPKLKYLELFMLQITDISALSNLTDLLDVNLCVTKTEDLSPLLSCKKLERIWIGSQTQSYLKNESLQQVLEAFPNAEFDLTSVSSTNLGWREHPRFFAYSEMFKTNTPVDPFLP